MPTSRLRRVALGCAAALTLLLPTPAVAAPVAADAQSPRGGAVHAAGDFVATVDFASLSTREVGPRRCELTVDGALTFSGTVTGVAEGTTTALVFAPCAEALASPPGTYADVFRFDGDFTGEVRGTPTSGPLRYAGLTRAGGGIDALITLRGDAARATLHADAQVAVGGSYHGVAHADS